METNSEFGFVIGIQKKKNEELNYLMRKLWKS
jgi:hypothetical protein